MQNTIVALFLGSLKVGSHKPCSRPVFTAREHGPWTRLVWTDLKCHVNSCHCGRHFEHWYLVSVFDVDWLFRQRNGAGDSFAELDFDLRGFRVQRLLDAWAVGHVEQLGHQVALIAAPAYQKQAAPITVYLRQQHRLSFLHFVKVTSKDVGTLCTMYSLRGRPSSATAASV